MVSQVDERGRQAPVAGNNVQHGVPGDNDGGASGWVVRHMTRAYYTECVICLHVCVTLVSVLRTAGCDHVPALRKRCRDWLMVVRRRMKPLSPRLVQISLHDTYYCPRCTQESNAEPWYNIPGTGYHIV